MSCFWEHAVGGWYTDFRLRFKRSSTATGLSEATPCGTIPTGASPAERVLLRVFGSTKFGTLLRSSGREPLLYHRSDRRLNHEYSV